MDLKKNAVVGVLCVELQAVLCLVIILRYFWIANVGFAICLLGNRQVLRYFVDVYIIFEIF